MVRPSRVLAVVLGLAGSASSGCSILYSTDSISSQTSDGGTVADAGPGGPSLCDASSFVFCDGFENGFGATQDDNGGGSATVDSTHVYRGAFALHSSMAATSSGARMAAQVLQSQAWPAHVFMRLFAFLPSPIAPQGAGLLNYLDVTNSAAGLVLYAAGNDPTLQISTFGVPNAGTVVSSTRAPLGEWACFEVEVDSGAHLVNAWMNDNALGDLSETVAVAALQTVAFGLSLGAPPAGPPYDAWFDEVAVDSRRIGCTR
jgi:hypothetical protein